MKTAKCKFPGCSHDARSRGWCQAHYGQFRRNGEAGLAPIRKKAPPLITITVRVPRAVERQLRTQAKKAGVTFYALTSTILSSATTG